MFKVNQSLIRYWEKEFDVINPHKNKKREPSYLPRRNIDKFLASTYNLVKRRGLHAPGRQRYRT
ncbi:MAG: MerR family transcriptional regulator [Bacteroidales bacterium]|nr:MerR family transcriptional regulator [Bacteroidales bacterium]